MIFACAAVHRHVRDFTVWDLLPTQQAPVFRHLNRMALDCHNRDEVSGVVAALCKRTTLQLLMRDGDHCPEHVQRCFAAGPVRSAQRHAALPVGLMEVECRDKPDNLMLNDMSQKCTRVVPERGPLSAFATHAGLTRAWHHSGLCDDHAWLTCGNHWNETHSWCRHRRRRFLDGLLR